MGQFSECIAVDLERQRHGFNKGRKDESNLSSLKNGKDK
jgi:hypothetical protein